LNPSGVQPGAWIVATGRSDYPNQINNVLAFPGIFRGALSVRARRINEATNRAAAHDIAGCIARRELSSEYIVPSVFNREVVQRVAAAVTEAAIKNRVARKGPPRRQVLAGGELLATRISQPPSTNLPHRRRKRAAKSFVAHRGRTVLK